MLECLVFVEDSETPSLTFKRFVLSNLHLGLSDRNVKCNRHHYIYLYVVTSIKILKYRVFNNVKCVNSNQLMFGKMCIEFGHPSHKVLIRCEAGKLSSFFRLFQRLCDERKTSNPKYTIPLIPADLKFVSKKPRVKKTESNIKEIISQIPNVSLRNEVLKNAHILHLPNSNLRDLPVQLGLLRWSEINLENNNLSNDDLSWLEELPVRRTLVSLNLSKNKMTSFPPALVDFYHLAFVSFQDNEIQYIPGTIGSLQCLRNLNLSNNQIRYLPASIVDLRLSELDLTNNYLTCSTPAKHISSERKKLGTTLRLEDLASTKIDSLFRRQLCNRECPRRLLEKLRCASQCICGKKSMPSAMNEYYVPLPTIRFSNTSCTHPQKSDKGSSIFLQYHFCIHANRCDSKKYQKMSSRYYFSLT